MKRDCIQCGGKGILGWGYNQEVDCCARCDGTGEVSVPHPGETAAHREELDRRQRAAIQTDS